LWWGFCGIEEEQEKKMKDMIADRNLNFGFTAYDSIYGININTKENSFILLS